MPIRVWLSEKEYSELNRKAKIAGLPKSTVIRMLLCNYEPKEKPDARFYKAMRQLSAIGNNINQLTVKANALGFIDALMLKAEALRWHRFQADIKAVFLCPGESNLKWQ
ncbi:MAG: plasmid mobilization protein [Acutalibacteraceae bacterium]